jgi:hypothetical protein
MRRHRKQKRDSGTVSATELAEMGFCEKRVLLAHLHGERLTPDQLRSVDRGRKAHDQFYREGLAAASATAADRRCFVATCLYGEAAWQTETLRRLRDEVLLRFQLGHRIVEAYYAIAPTICRLLVWLPWLQSPARVLVGGLARVARGSSDERGP